MLTRRASADFAPAYPAFEGSFRPSKRLPQHQVVGAAKQIVRQLVPCTVLLAHRAKVTGRREPPLLAARPGSFIFAFPRNRGLP